MTDKLIMTTAQREQFPDLIDSLLYGTQKDVLVAKNAMYAMLQSLPMVSAEPVAWEAPAGIGLMRFVTNKKFKKFSLPVQRNYRPFKCASCTGRPKAKEQHSTEQNFQHFLSYSCTVTDPVNRLRMAYFHGANENLSKDIALYTSPQAPLKD